MFDAFLHICHVIPDVWKDMILDHSEAFMICANLSSSLWCQAFRRAERLEPSGRALSGVAFALQLQVGATCKHVKTWLWVTWLGFVSGRSMNLRAAGRDVRNGSD